MKLFPEEVHEISNWILFILRKNGHLNTRHQQRLWPLGIKDMRIEDFSHMKKGDFNLMGIEDFCITEISGAGKVCWRSALTG